MNSSSSACPPENPVQQPGELVQIVDASNNPIGSATRKSVREHNLLHRCSFVVVRNSQGDIYMQQRVSFKETYPSFFDPAPGGVVGYGETYLESATREIQEEMGVSGVELVDHGSFYFGDATCRLWGNVFSCQYDGPFNLDPNEVASGQFITLQELERLLQTGPVCPDSKVAVKLFLQAIGPA